MATVRRSRDPELPQTSARLFTRRWQWVRRQSRSPVIHEIPLSRDRLTLVVYIGINIGLVLQQRWDVGFERDWELWRSLPIGGGLYGDLGAELPYVWSPLIAPVMAAAVAYPMVWAFIHIAAPFLVRDLRFTGLLLVSWGFWADVAGGNTFTFSIVSGIMAWRGNRSAALVYVALLLLTPRPVLVPLAMLLLFRMPEIRLPAALLLAANILLVWPYASDWVFNMVEYASVTPHDMGPRALVGFAWIPIAAAIAVLLTLRQRPGWAGLFASAYWLPQYFLMPLVELRRHASGKEPKRLL